MSKVTDIVKPFTAQEVAALARDEDCLKRPMWFWEACSKFMNNLDAAKIECSAEAPQEVKDKARKKLWSKVAPIPLKDLTPYIDNEKVFDTWKKLNTLALSEASEITKNADYEENGEKAHDFSRGMKAEWRS